MAAFKQGVWVKHLNSMGSELDSVFVEAPYEAGLEMALIAMIRQNVIEPGDSFKIEEGESES
jgi:hypothetical protein